MEKVKAMRRYLLMSTTKSQGKKMATEAAIFQHQLDTQIGRLGNAFLHTVLALCVYIGGQEKRCPTCAT